MLLQDPVACRVHGNLARGERPYVSFLHVRYTSTELARRSALIGTRLRIHVDPADLRQLTACTEDGQIMEPLLASGPWRHEPHSLRLRQLVFKAKRARELTFGPGDNPIEAFLSLRRKQAPKKRRAASDIAQVQRERRAERKAAMPASTASTTATSDDALAPSATPGSQLATGPVKGQALSIRRGFAR